MPILNMIGGGAGSNAINVFCQPIEPLSYEGIWFKTPEKHPVKNIIVDTSVYVSNSWLNTTFNLPAFPTNRGKSVVYKDEIYWFGGKYNDSEVKSVWKYTPKNNTWSKLNDMLLARYDFSIAIKDNYVYILGTAGPGVCRFCERYDLETQTSTQISKISITPNAVYVNSNCGTAIVEDKIYQFGGSEYLPSGQTCYYGNKARVYNITNDTWSEITSLPSQGTACPVCHAVGNKIYILGGRVSSSCATLRQVFIYDTTTNTYTMGTSSSYNFSEAGSVLVGDEIYIFGGFGDMAPIKTCSKYNVTTNTWTSLPDCSVSIKAATASLINDKIYVYGGVGVLANGSTNFYGTFTDIFSLTSKQYENNDIVLLRQNDIMGQYATQFFSMSNKVTGKFIRFTTKFDDAYIFYNGELQKKIPTFYGNGVSWVKFKNF